MSYLKFDRHWKSYGRVIDKKVEGPHLILNLQDGKQIKTFYREEHEAIKVYDWVAIDSNGSIVQVTPSSLEPQKTSLTKDRILKWNRFLKLIRLFFENKEFLEIQTPSLVVCPGTEPTLESFETTLKQGSRQTKVFLPTSPELHLKKALSLGFDKIFEIAKCYRNGEVTELHQPEFWMLEWYRSFANLLDIQKDCIELIYFLADQMKVARPQGVECVTIRQLFKRNLNFDLTPHTTREEYLRLAQSQGLHVQDSYTIDDLFFLLMLERIEPSISKDKIVFVEKYPPFQAALARKDDEGWSERFEIYWKGLELANAFDELNKPQEQRARALEDLQKREGRNSIQLDEEFFKSLESGMPPAAGIALGVERLFMTLFDIQRIDELRLFPIR